MLYCLPMAKRLMRSKTNKVLSGVMGGIGEYFEIDPVLVRLIYLLATVFTGVVPGIIGYILAVAVVPPAPTPSNDSASV